MENKHSQEESSDILAGLGDNVEVIASTNKVNPAIEAKRFYDDYINDFLFVQGDFYKYATGIWEKIDVIEIRKMLVERLGTLSRKRLIEDVIYHLQTKFLPSTWQGFNPSASLLCFKDKVLNIYTGEILRHSKEYYQTIQLPYSIPKDLNKIPDCKLWTKFLSEIELSSETILCLQEWFGYCLTSETRLEKVLNLVGGGSNGKSVVLGTLSSLLGKTCLNADLAYLLKDPFNMIQIDGKLACISADLNLADGFKETFKGLVSGEKQFCRDLHKSGIEVRPIAKFLFSSNRYVPTKDFSEGYFRRFDIIEFNRKFEIDERDEHLKDKLKTELSEIFLWAYQGLKRLIHNNWKMTKSQDMEDAKTGYLSGCSEIRRFIRECCEKDKSYSVIVDELFESYKQFCKDEEISDYDILKKNKFGVEIKALGYPKKQDTKIIATDNKKVRPYRHFGLRLKEDAPVRENQA